MVLFFGSRHSSERGKDDMDVFKRAAGALLFDSVVMEAVDSASVTTESALKIDET